MHHYRLRNPLVVVFLLLLTGCASGDEAAAELRDINGVLDDWHRAAAQADEARYFGHLAKDAIFMGTDPTERWSKDDFLKYVHPYFSKGKGWNYLPRNRHVELSPDRRIAWFDERLGNEKYGELRGTGVLRSDSGTWKIVHYSMTFPIPNEMTRKVVEQIKAQVRP